MPKDRFPHLFQIFWELWDELFCLGKVSNDCPELKFLASRRKSGETGWEVSEVNLYQ
ncbi:hypothetical protein [Tumidithrix elongata]|uniref:hypothetical protein n=1 Tax=Tumidithrix elongata TaxID=3088357 RepID=UPI002ED115B7